VPAFQKEHADKRKIISFYVYNFPLIYFNFKHVIYKKKEFIDLFVYFLSCFVNGIFDELFSFSLVSYCTSPFNSSCSKKENTKK